jgi:hypothetical protein
MDKLFTVEPSSWTYYVLGAVAGALIVRVFISLWRNFETDRASPRTLGKIFLGIGYREDEKKPPVAADYGLGFILGVIELLAYPLLLKAGYPVFIGAWLAFKTAHRMGYAPEYKRGTFNRYLVANALILITSYVLARNTF